MSTYHFSCERLARQVFRPAQGRASLLGRAVAVTAAHEGAGVSYVCATLADTLNQEQPGSALLTSSRELLESTSREPLPADDLPGEKSLAWNGGFGLSHTGKGEFVEGSGSPNLLNQRLRSLRMQYRDVIIDTPCLKQSSDLLSLCSFVDGVILVVEANKTNRSQLAYLEKNVVESSGTIVGHILNKRTYPIPPWLNHHLERMGI